MTRAKQLREQLQVQRNIAKAAPNTYIGSLLKQQQLRKKRDNLPTIADVTTRRRAI